MTLPVEINPLLFTPSGGAYEITRSLRFDGTSYLTRTPASASNRKTWTWSCWVKRVSVSTDDCMVSQGADITNSTKFEISNANELQYLHRDSTTITDELVSTQLFRDTSAWYHLVCAVDTTQATDTNRIKFYVNGSQISSFSTSNYPTLNFDTDFNTTTEMTIGAIRDKSNDFEGYMTEINFIDGQQLDASSFGRTDPVTGVWIPKKYTGSYGTNGFYLDFSDPTSTTTLGYDRSGNGNHFTLTNFSVTAGVGYDSMTDTPTNNFCVFNYAGTNSADSVVSNGGLQTDYSINTQTCVSPVTIPTPKSGKWYAEFTMGTIGGNNDRDSVGIIPSYRIEQNSTGNLGEISTSSKNIGFFSDSYGYGSDGTKCNNDAPSAYGASFATNDIISVLLDLDAGTLIFWKNGVSQGTAFTGITADNFHITVGMSTGSTTRTGTYHANYGQRPFSYTPPAGYKTLCTQNLPDPIIKKPLNYTNTVIYTGNGTSQTVTGISYTPDLVWIKSRSAAGNNAVFDSVRGANNQLITNLTLDAVNRPASLLSFNSTGFTLGANTEVNANGTTYVAWTWDETPTAGFDIVTWTGTGANANVSHALGAAPAMIIGKARTTAGTDQGWPVWHKDFTNGTYSQLNSDALIQTGATVFNNNIVANSTHFSVGTSALTNTLNDTYIYYLWSEIVGYSKFGTYTGNLNADGPFVFCGFRPKFILIKRLSGSIKNWALLDSTRSTFNVASARLSPDTNLAEDVSNEIDFLSNGFKLRSIDSSTNDSGNYLFAAFAEIPFKYALAR